MDEKVILVVKDAESSGKVSLFKDDFEKVRVLSLTKRAIQGTVSKDTFV